MINDSRADARVLDPLCCNKSTQSNVVHDIKCIYFVLSEFAPLINLIERTVEELGPSICCSDKRYVQLELNGESKQDVRIMQK